jgi:peptide/nickel transport system permease protein
MIRLNADRLAWLWIIILVLVMILGPMLAPYNPRMPIGAPITPPGKGNLLGTDALGRDLLSRLIIGARYSLISTLFATLITVGLGLSLSLLATTYGGLVDSLLVGLANTGLSIPGLLLAMLLVAAAGPGLPTVILAVGLGGSPGFIRLSRSILKTYIHEGYVDAAKAMGAGQIRIATHHLLPNAFPQLLALATTHYAWAFLGTTTLTFLGLAGDPAIPEWGAMLDAGRTFLIQAPALSLLPGILISMTVLAIHQIGEGMSSHFDSDD